MLRVEELGQDRVREERAEGAGLAKRRHGRGEQAPAHEAFPQEISASTA